MEDFINTFQSKNLPFDSSSYATGPNRKKWFNSSFPNLSFYWNLLKIVVSAGRKAHKSRYTNDEWIKSSLTMIKALEFCGTKVYFEGLENFKDLTTPCIFAANHMSTLETFALPCLIESHKPVTFVIKKSLLKYPYFGALLNALDPIVVGRENIRDDLSTMLKGGEERLNNGTSIIVFPQSSRSVEFDPNKFNSIGVKLAKRSYVPVIPVALKTNAWGNGKKFKDFGPIKPHLDVHIRFGKAIYVNGNGKDEHDQVVKFIVNSLSEWS